MLKINPINFKASQHLKFQQKDTNSQKDDCRVKFEYKGVKFPVFNAAKKIKYSEIAEFHNSIREKSDKDEISYHFYTTINDIGSGFVIFGTPLSKADDEAKEEMVKEIKRLISNKSDLTADEKRMLAYMYQNNPEIRIALRNPW